MKIDIKCTLLLKESLELIVTLDEVKKYLKIDYDVDDGLIKSFIKSSQEEIEEVIGKNLLPKEWRQDNSIILDNYDCDFNFSFPVFEHSTIKIPLTQKPVLEADYVRVGDRELGHDDYVIALNSCVPHLCIRTKSIIGTAKKGIISVSIKYKTGMYENVHQIPERMKLCVMMLVSSKYLQRDFSEMCTYSSPIKNIKSLLNSFIDYKIA